MSGLKSCCSKMCSRRQQYRRSSERGVGAYLGEYGTQTYMLIVQDFHGVLWAVLQEEPQD